MRIINLNSYRNISLKFGRPLFISLIRACVANKILKRIGSVCEGRGGGGVELRIVNVGVTFRFVNRDAISDQNMPFLYALVVPLEAIPEFRL